MAPEMNIPADLLEQVEQNRRQRQQEQARKQKRLYAGHYWEP